LRSKMPSRALFIFALHVLFGKVMPDLPCLAEGRWM